MILDLVEKIFMIILGILVVVILFGIFNQVTQSSSCQPKDLYKEEGILGFGGGIFDNTFDTICSSVLDINSAIWGVYVRFSVQIFGLRPALSGISNGLWGLGKIFCKTHSNFEYVNRQGRDAISDPQVFKELFLYETERCWNLFEGKNLNGISNISRNPIANIGYFECAEIIYSFPEGEGLSLKEIYERINMDNTCGYPANIPKTVPEQFNSEKSEIQWCVQKDLLKDYWWDRDAQLGKYDGSECDFIDKGIIDSSACLGMRNAMCSFGQINGYEQSDDNVWIIQGTGKISIYYYDHFVDTNIIKMIIESITIGTIVSFTPLGAVGGIASQIIYYIGQYDQILRPNQLYVYYEKYDLPAGKCEGNLECDIPELKYYFPQAYGDSDCYYAYGCHYENAFSTSCTNKPGYNCSSFITKSKCESNNLAGCYWTTSGTCKASGVLGNGCGQCAVDLGMGSSNCDKATLCKEYWYWKNNIILTQSCTWKNYDTRCSSIKSKNECEQNACAGCLWEE